MLLLAKRLAFLSDKTVSPGSVATMRFQATRALMEELLNELRNETVGRDVH
jgi:hypothetical protein